MWCRSAESEGGLGNLTKALRGIRLLLDERMCTLRKQQDFDQDAVLARNLQEELEQEDVRRQVCLPAFSPPLLFPLPPPRHAHTLRTRPECQPLRGKHVP